MTTAQGAPTRRDEIMKPKIVPPKAPKGGQKSIPKKKSSKTANPKTQPKTNVPVKPGKASKKPMPAPVKK